MRIFLTLSLLFFLLSLNIHVAPAEESEDNILYVDDDNIDGPWDGSFKFPYQFIQDAVDVSQDGDIISVESGFYYEEVTVNKSISLIGKDRNNTIIETNKKLPRNDTIYIYANNVIITGFKIQNSPRCGIFLAASNVNINNNIFCNNSHGIHFYLSNNHVSISNNILFNNYCGIYLVSCKNDNISHNQFFNNDFGIRVSHSINNTIFKNNIKSNVKIGVLLFEKSSNNYLWKNNFINNTKDAYFNLFSHQNIWEGNYWNEPKYKPFPIVGCIGLFILPWINFDWHPSQEPYDI